MRPKLKDYLLKWGCKERLAIIYASDFEVKLGGIGWYAVHIFTTVSEDTVLGRLMLARGESLRSRVLDFQPKHLRALAEFADALWAFQPYTAGSSDHACGWFSESRVFALTDNARSA